MLHPSPRITYTTEISTDEIPDNIELEHLIKEFKKHSYNLGLWHESPKQQEYSPLKVTHVIRDVNLTENGKLKLEYFFLNTLKFNKLRNKSENKSMKFIPIINEPKEGINTYRFDIIEEE